MINKLTDRYIDVYFYRDKDIVFTLKTPKTGRKPEIQVSSELIPENNCYKTILTITNMGMSTFDIRQWTGMVIDVGFRDGPSMRFDCPILTAYVSSAPPDSQTTFSGLAVGTTSGLLNGSPFSFYFDNPKITWGELIGGCLQAIGAEGRKQSVRLASDTRNTVLEMVADTEFYAENGVSVITWLATQLKEWGSKLGKSFLVQAFNNEVSIIELNAAISEQQYKTETVVELPYVTSASFTGALLQVQAPFVPSLRPGGLFRMEPIFFDANSTPNVVKTTDYLDPNNIYRVITMSINFSTNGDSSMSIKALSLTAVSSEAPVTLSTDLVKDSTEEVKELEKPIEVHIGKASADEPIINLFQYSITLPTMRRTSLREFVGEDVPLGGQVWREITYVTFGKDRYLTKWEEYEQEIDEQWKKITGRNSNRRVIKNLEMGFDNAQLWIILAYCNYKYAMQMKDNIVLKAMDATVPSGFTQLSKDTIIYVPTFNGESELKKFAPLYKECIEADTSQLAYIGKQQAQAIYAYLQGVE